MINTLVFSLCLVVPILIWTKNPLIFRQRPFLFFGLHILLERKRMPPRKPAPGAIIFSNASGPICSFCKPRFFPTCKKNVHLLSTSRYLICLKYNRNFVCNLSENCRLQLCAFLKSHSQKKTYSFMFLRQILSSCNLKTSFAKLVKVLVLVLELFYGTRTRVRFSISVLVLEVFCGTRTRKLSTRLHHCN